MHKDKTDNNFKPGVYRIPCTCEKVYHIGETNRNLKLRQKEHNDCCTKCHVDKSALAKPRELDLWRRKIDNWGGGGGQYSYIRVHRP